MQINVLEYFERGAARQCPGKIGVVDQDRSYTFGELERYSKQCAALLIGRANVIKQPIAVYLPKGAAAILADLGIAYSGNIYANLDTKSPPLRLQGVLDQLGPALAITSRDLAPALAAAGLPPEKLFYIEDAIGGEAAYDSAFLWRRLERVIDTDPLAIIHTSGSTGIPKGVALNHRSTIDFMDWCFDRFPFDGSERIGSLTQFYFDIYTSELILCLAKGATLVVIPDQFAVFPARLVQFLAQQSISFIFWVPSMMVNISSLGLLDHADLSALRTVFFAGEVFPMKHLNRWRRALPAARFVNLYGPIEITVDCTYFEVERDFNEDQMLPIGFPCRNTDILILNEKNELCRTGERGELCVRGSSLAMGYWNDPVKTAQAFVQNPLNAHYPELIYRTGDQVCQNERGEIMFLGRQDCQIKHLGHRIDLSEIEYQVVAHEGIVNACVLYNESKKQITLFYQTNGGDLPPEAIRRRLAQIFPKYMLPTAFHQLQELPRNPNGKIDRRGLALQLQTVP